MRFTPALWRGRLGANRDCQVRVERQTCTDPSRKCACSRRRAARL